MKVVIAAAGTAGHINPGIAIADTIKKYNTESEITFIGTKQGLENDLVKRAGYNLRHIEAYGFYKRFNITNFIKIYKTLFGSVSQAKKLLKELNPDLVIGMGGYICMPVVKAASKLNIPVILHEANSYPGLAIKTLENRVERILTAFPDTKRHFKQKEKVYTVGNPIKIYKKEYSEEEITNIFKVLDLNPKLKTVLVFGGSQGAQNINNNIFEVVKSDFFKNNDYQLIWATGQNQFDDIKLNFEDIGIKINSIKNVKILPYIYNMQELINVVDLVVARSGAMTVSEIATCGKPSIFIPLPSRSANRQLDNALVLERIGAAEIIEDDKLNDKILKEKINKILSDEHELKEMGRLAETKGNDNVLEKIYKHILDVLQQKDKS